IDARGARGVDTRSGAAIRGIARLARLPLRVRRRGHVGAKMIPPTIEWAGDRVRLIDQRQLPGELVIAEAVTVDELCDFIRTLAVRGAPALGAAGAMGIAL